MARLSIGVGPVRVSQRIGGGRRRSRNSGSTLTAFASLFILPLALIVGLAVLCVPVFWTMTAAALAVPLRLIGRNPGWGKAATAGNWLWQSIPRCWHATQRLLRRP